ncbi:MAG: class I SAM-dependent methyltransferase [Ruminococcus sp.]|nr:class I SAM-dependent methyltransferase [Ruminococcus sp.]
MDHSYNSFARFYDRLTANVDYKAIADLVDSLIKKHSEYDEVVLDLACGTGSVSEQLALKGYDVIGVDNSQEMLEAAQERFDESGLDVTLLEQDMTELDLWGAVDCTVCLLDSLDHLHDASELKKAFERVSMYTCVGGLFVFDLNTEYKHRNVLANNAFNYDFDDLFCAWQNELLPSGDVHIYLDFFEKADDGRYIRYSDDFTEILFEDSFVESTLAENGFELIGRYDDFSLEPVKETSQRVLWVCKRV